MTFLGVALLGAGILLIASSLDNTPLTSTFQKIMNGQPINWSGSGETATDSPPKPGH